MNIIYKVFYLFLLVPTIGFAQREVLYSQYLVTPLSINPATAGSRETFHLTALLRRKWFGIRNAPITQSVTADGTVANKRIGLGFQALNDRMGLYQATGFYGSVAYRFALPALARLSVGVMGGLSVLPFTNLNPTSSLNQTVGSFGVGVYYQSDRFFAGLSAPELGGQVNQIGLVVNTRPVMLQAGAPFAVSDHVTLIPSVLVSKSKNQPLGVDVNLRSWINQSIGLTVSYRHNSPGLVQTSYVQALAEYQLTKAIRLGYIFNSQTPENPNAMMYFERSVHEIMLRFSPNVLETTY